jgi:two-component sensor histidine kinase
MEIGGPKVSKPTRRGFGSRLIKTALAGDFRGEVQLDYDPDGLLCELTTEMKNLNVAMNGLPNAIN